MAEPSDETPRPVLLALVAEQCATSPTICSGPPAGGRQMLGVDVRTLRGALERGEIPAVRVGGVWRVRRTRFDGVERALVPMRDCGEQRGEQRDVDRAARPAATADLRKPPISPGWWGRRSSS